MSQMNHTHRHALGLGLVAAAIALLLSRNPRTPEEMHNVTQRAQTTEQAGVANPGTALPARPGVAPSMSQPVTQLPISRLAPNQEKLRNEVRANPDSPPRSLVQFSQELGRRTDQALQDPGQARSTMAEIEGCLSDSAVAAQAQALCLKNADRLAEKYPELRERRDSAVTTSSLEARRIYSSLTHLRQG